MEGITEPDKCTGCKICADICPHQAIEYRDDQDGFWYPHIDKEHCVDCGKCVRSCPENNEYTNDNINPKVFSAWHKADDIRMKSTSGGVFFALAKTVIDQGGYVAGCAYSADYKSAYHMVIHKVEDLDQLMISKYLQSDTRQIYREIKKLLGEGMPVLFSGTSCQVNALYQYLGDKVSNLYTMDLICHGVNSPKAFAAYISEQEKRNKSKVSALSLRDKRQGWLKSGTYMEFENGKTYFAVNEEDLWSQGFLKHLYMRKSCYKCRYRRFPRVADITVGDYWGITNVSSSSLHKGVSAVLLNSQKGEQLFEEAKKELIFKETSLLSVRKRNSILEKETVLPKERSEFSDLLNKYSFSKAVNKCCASMEQERRTGYMKKGVVSFVSGGLGAAIGAAAVNQVRKKELQENDELLKKNIQFYSILVQWLTLKQRNIRLDQYFKKNHYKTIAIYGMKELGERLYYELKDSDIDVLYAIDKNPDGLCEEIKVVPPGEGLEKVDVIVVTATYYFYDIQEELETYTDCPIISLEDVVFECE